VSVVAVPSAKRIRTVLTSVRTRPLMNWWNGDLFLPDIRTVLPWENATVATALLSDLVERGLDPEQGTMLVIDGAKALRKAIRTVFGDAPVQRCVRRKERNVLDHLPERDRPQVKLRLRRAWTLDDHTRALDQLQRLAGELDRSYPGAASSLREGMEETLTLTRLGVTGSLKRTLESTNPCESMLEIVRRTQRNVKRWSSGEMALRWTAAGMLEAERQFRKISGYRDLATLVIAIERDHDRRRTHADAARTFRPTYYSPERDMSSPAI
jgi:putative transposase